MKSHFLAKVNAGLIAAIWISFTVILLIAKTNAADSTAKEWPVIGGDAENTRYSQLHSIRIENVGKLRGAWVQELDSPSRSAPVVSEGAIYTADAGEIYKLNASTGDVVWKVRPEGGSPGKGVALGEGMVFCGLTDAHVIALDQQTGRLIWSGFIGNSQADRSDSNLTSFTSETPKFVPQVGFVATAPTYVSGIVIAGLSGGDAGSRGRVSALDAKSGKLIWTFYVIPTMGDPGSETWPKAGDSLLRGGGAVWSPAAVDLELGLVYLGTGNAVPSRGGETRIGDNLYTASILALDFKSGRLRWFFQLTHHDLWDMDVATPIVLYSARIGGRNRKALAAMRTDGNLFLLDRLTGKPLFAIEERAVSQDIRMHTAVTQPFPVNADQFGPRCSDPDTIPPGFQPSCYFDPNYYDKPNVVAPLMTARSAPMSYSPMTHSFYVMGSVTSWWYPRVEDPYASYISKPPGSKEYGIYAAIDSRTQKIRWIRRSPWGLAFGSGALTTASNLLFHTEADGNVQANDARSGEQLWQFQTGSLPLFSGLAGGVPIGTYYVNEVQYVLVQVDRALWAFNLNGTLSPRAAPKALPTVSGFTGIVKHISAIEREEISIATRRPGQIPGTSFMDEYAFFPARVRVTAGEPFKWTNYGVLPHTIVSEDGSFLTSTIMPGKSESMTIGKPGTYIFFSREFPWSRGELVVK